MFNYPVIGALVGVGFALIWAIGGSLRVASPGWRQAALGVSFSLSLLLTAALLRRARRSVPEPGASRFNWRAYAMAVAFEAIAIPLAALACRRGGRPDLILPAVAGIVGLHFFGLALALASTGRVFVWTGTAMVALALAGLACATPASIDGWVAITGLGCAAILWAAAASVLW